MLELLICAKITIGCFVISVIPIAGPETLDASYTI